MLISRYLFIKLEQKKLTTIGPFLRSIGQKILRWGQKAQGSSYVPDRCK